MIAKNSLEGNQKANLSSQINQIEKHIFDLKKEDPAITAVILWDKISKFNNSLQAPLEKEKLKEIMSEALDTFVSKELMRDKELKILLMNGSKISKISLTGVLDDKFYHTIFIPEGQQFKPFLLLEDGTSYPVLVKGKNPKDKYSYTDYKNQILIYNTGEPLWFAENLVEAPSKEGIMMVIDGKSPATKELYNELIKAIKEYYDFYNEQEAHMVTTHVIHTYFLGLLGQSFYLLLEGEKNTGKSSLQTVMSKLQFNGCFSGKATTSSLVRKIHFLGCSVNLDEFDKLGKDEKKTVTGILNSGMYANGTYEITNMNAKSGGRSQIQVFRTFSAKTFSANPTSFADSFISRCIVINTVRNTRPVKSIHKANETELERFQGLRNKLFAYCMLNGKKIRDDIDTVHAEFNENKSFGRRADVFSIICGILKHFGRDYKKIAKYLSERELIHQEDLTDNRYHLVLRYLWEKMGPTVTSRFIQVTNEEIRQYVMKELQMDEHSKYKPTPRSIGAILTKYRIIDKPGKRMTSGINKGKYAYEIDVVKILERIERSSFEDLKEEIKTIQFDLPK